MVITENVEKFLRDLAASYQMTRLYGPNHAKFTASVDNVFASLEEIFKDRAELVIGIIGEELAFEKDIFFELSKVQANLIANIKERKVEKIVFYQTITKEDMCKFIVFLNTPKDQINKAPQDYLSAMGINNIFVGKIDSQISGLSQEQLKEASTYLSLYDNSLNKFSTVIDSVLNIEKVDYLSVKLTVNNIIEGLSARFEELLKLSTVKRYDAATYTHILNVSILSMYFSSKLGFSRNDISEIGVAALFHDIGKLFISRKIIRKTDRLSETEFSMMKSHTIQGAQILLNYVDALGILPVVVAFEHHLKYNLEGYPHLSLPHKLHLASLIVSICDVYDALSQRRSYKNDYPPEAIYNIMMKDRGVAFESRLLDEFFKIIGVWPVGTIVSLTDASVAVVRKENEDDIFSPQIEVISPSEKKQTIDLRIVKPGNKIERYLNPFTEGKQYMSLI